MSPPRRRKAPERRERAPAAARRNATSGAPTTDGRRPVELIRPADDPTVMLRSLSSPPLPGRETVAVHYFAAVAEKAASLAVALAAASELLDAGDDDPDFEGPGS